MAPLIVPLYRRLHQHRLPGQVPILLMAARPLVLE
jgi:hypothetical protein